ncbi:catalase family protein [Acidisphaera sp. L21]|uniref:catalase family protein n=1 Tax=Acidisphaera sp. L21 TaxID=1641851 RepID=UPI00131EA15D|nr:catalase family protein [Acidisphaera sp. L21]
MSGMLAQPLRYTPDMEQPADDEAQTIQSLTETLGKISQTTFENSGHATRSVHAKGHGLLRGKLTVLDNLPAELAQGLFAEAAEYEVAMRFSTIPGDVLDDSVSTPRGLAIKVVGVEGARLPGGEDDVTQDFVMANAPAFSAPDPKKFLANLKMLAATTDKAEGAKKMLSAVARGTESLLEAFGGKSPTVTTMGGQPETNILGETYYSQAPLLYGDYVAKIGVFPIFDLSKQTGAPVEVNDNPDALRDAVAAHFAVNGGEWELRVQLLTNPETMPIEDASVIWPEDESPYQPVARLTVKPQASWSDDGVKSIDDGMAFGPWHGLAAHRPLGGIMRSRNTTYTSSATFRGQHNGCPMHQPKALHGA